MHWISKHIDPNLYVLTDEDARLDMVMLSLLLSILTIVSLNKFIFFQS